MKTMAKKILVYLAVAVFVCGVSLSSAQAYEGRGQDGDKEHKAKMMEKLTEKLELTQEQQEQMKEMKEGNREERQKLQEEMKANREALKAELQKPETDKAAIDKTVAAMKDAQGKLIDLRVQNFMQMKEILTPEQFQKMSELKEDHKGKKRNGGKRKRGPRDKEHDDE